MSHRVTTKTAIKDKEIAMEAIKKAGYDCEDQGGQILITSGPMQNSVIDLGTGVVTGDTDYGHSAEALASLNQSYGEVKYVSECMRQGITIESRTVDQQTGDVVLLCASM